MGKKAKGIFGFIVVIFFIGGIFILFIGSITLIIQSFRAKKWFEFAIGIYLALWFGFTVVFQLSFHFLQKIKDYFKNTLSSKKQKNLALESRDNEIFYPGNENDDSKKEKINFL
ncbi:MAG: hypothetical protein ACTSRK_00295 [Promethearchaeota archaeon]